MSNGKPILLAGLGNPFSGDDGIGCVLARLLARDPRLPEQVEVIEGGTDLFRLQDRLEDRRWIVLVDALLDSGEPGRLLRFDGDLRELDHHGGSVHHLSPTEALRLLRCLNPPLADVPVTFLGVTIAGTTMSPRLSSSLQSRVDPLAAGILRALAEPLHQYR